MSAFAQLVIALVILAAGGAAGIKWHAVQDAIADLEAAGVRASEAKRQIRAIDKAATTHAATLAGLNTKLGDAREKIALLSGRECLDAGTVGLLNDIAADPVRAPAGQPESAAPAPAAGSGLRFASDRDTAAAIAICRARYAELSSQVNQILDIEETRHPPD